MKTSPSSEKQVSEIVGLRITKLMAMTKVNA